MGVYRKWTQEQLLDIKRLYTEEGWTLAQIGKKYSAKGDTISKKLKEQGVTIRRGNISKNRRLNENYFSVIDRPEKAYFLGLLFTDGNITLDKENIRVPALRIELVETDKEILEKFKEELQSDASLSYNKRTNRKNGTFSLIIRNRQLANDLSKFNIIPNKTYLVDNLIIPENFKIDFFRGLIDGDGSIYQLKTGHWQMNICGHSLNVVSQISELGNSFIDKKGSGHISFYDNVYRHTWNEKDTKKLLEIMYKNCKIAIARKQLKAMAAIEDKKS